MKKIISLSAVREKRARVTPMRTEDYKLGIENPKAAGKSSSYKKSHLRQSVNPYETIQILKRIIKLQRQGICLLTQELLEVKRQ